MTNVRLLTYNTHLFGGTIPGTLGGQEYEDDERMAEIVKRIAQLSPDIVCLQEAWADSTRAYFAEHLAHAGYPNTYYPDEEPGLKISSGLMVLAKQSISETDFSQFSAGIGSDGWATKGWIEATVKSSSQVLAHLFITHTQADDDLESQKVRARQFEQLIGEVRKRSGKYGASVPVICCGDFNVIGEMGNKKTAEYSTIENMLGQIDLVDSYRISNPYTAPDFEEGFTLNVYTNTLAKHFSPDLPIPRQRLDYIFANVANAGLTINSCAVDTKTFKYISSGHIKDDSDHFPVVLDYSIP